MAVYMPDEQREVWFDLLDGRGNNRQVRPPILSRSRLDIDRLFQCRLLRRISRERCTNFRERGAAFFTGSYAKSMVNTTLSAIFEIVDARVPANSTRVVEARKDDQSDC